MTQQCPKCGIQVPSEQMTMHLWQVHDILICPLCHDTMPSVKIWRHAGGCQTTHKLKTSDKSDFKKSNMVTEWVFCNECGKIQPVTRRKCSNNKTPVRRCDACKKKRIFKTPEKIDALDHSVQGGAFDMNRRRH